MTDNSKDISVGEVMPGLFIGNMACVESESALKQLNITAVVSVVSRYRKQFPPPESPYDSSGRQRHPLEKLFDVRDRLTIFVDDSRSDNIFRYFEGACGFIDRRLSQASIRDRASSRTRAYNERKRGSPIPRDHMDKKSGRVLVHCTLGISRSVTIVAAYIMWKWGFSASRALQHIKKMRSMSAPNEGFIDQLLVWEELNCNPWLSRRLHIRPRAYYDMINRLENHKRVREVIRAIERAAKDKAPRVRFPTNGNTRARGTEGNTIRYSTRARH